MLNKKTLINNKNTKKSENKGLTPAVDMIGYTDIMINNNNKKDTMTKNTKVKNTMKLKIRNYIPEKEEEKGDKKARKNIGNILSKITYLLDYTGKKTIVEAIEVCKNDKDTKETILKKFGVNIHVVELMYKAAIIDESKTYNELSFRDLGDQIKAFKKLDNDKQQ